MHRMATHINLRGTFYEVGKQLGELKKTEVQAIVEFLKQSEFYVRAKEYLGTSDGSTAYMELYDATATYRSDYLDELKGVVDGAGVSFDDLFLLNIGPELTAAMAALPGGSHNVSYASIFDGCINIFLELPDGQVYLAHTEDVDPFYKGLGFMMSVDIVDAEGATIEQWTEYTIAGVVPGSGFGFNSNGVAFAHNNIYPKGFKSRGIPRRFMCRKLMTVQDAGEAKAIMMQNPGIASASTMFFLKQWEGGFTSTTVLETVYGTQGGQVAEFEPSGVYHHCNIFQHLRHACHPEQSSVHRAAVVCQYIQRGEIRTPEDLLSAVSDQNDTSFPVFRTGKHPDYLETVASGLFDLQKGTFLLYTDKPSCSTACLVLPLYTCRPST